MQGGGILQSVVQIVVAIIGLAIISVLVSRNANTAGVVRESFSGLTGLVGAAVSPVNAGAGQGPFH